MNTFTSSGYVPTFTASGSILPSTFVKGDPSNDFRALQAGVDDLCIGIAQVGPVDSPGLSGSSANAANLDDPLQVFGPYQPCPLRVGTGGVTRFTFLKPDATGAAIPANDGDYPAAFALESGAAGEMILALPLMGPRSTSKSIKSLAASATLVSADAGKWIEVTAADVIVTLPLAATVKAGGRFTVTANATSTALQAGVTGIIVAIQGTDKMFGLTTSAPAAAKGALNAKTTAIAGDTLIVESDGTNYFVIGQTGTWSRQP